MCANIIFDADDTLWKTGELYDQVRNEFAQMLVEEGLGPLEVIIALAKKIDLENFAKLGQSPARFPQSLVDTYEQRCKDLNRKTKKLVRDKVQKKGEEVFQRQAKVYENVAEILGQLESAGHELYLWSEGDEGVQRERLKQSQLEEHFGNRVRIAPKGKVEDVYQCLHDWPLTKANTWIVGNDFSIDIDPAVKAGLKAVWIPSCTGRDTPTLPPLPKDSAYLVSQFSDLAEILIDQEIQPSAATDVVYLFVSAYHALYQQYVLDILAGPRGFRVRFPYRTTWLPGLYRMGTGPRNFCTLVKGNHKPAVVVFTDERSRVNQDVRPISCRSGL